MYTFRPFWNFFAKKFGNLKKKCYLCTRKWLIPIRKQDITRCIALQHTYRIKAL